MTRTETQKKRLNFLRTKDGVKLMGWNFTLHASYQEIAELQAFVVSGARASTPRLENAWERSTLRHAPLKELEAELERRANLRAARSEDEARAEALLGSDTTDGPAE